MAMVRAKRVGALSLEIRCHLPLTNIAGRFYNELNWKNQWLERILNWREGAMNWREQILQSEKLNSDESSRVQQVPNQNNCRILGNSEQISQPRWEPYKDKQNVTSVMFVTSILLNLFSYLTLQVKNDANVFLGIFNKVAFMIIDVDCGFRIVF